jgi:hypothetical protein
MRRDTDTGPDLRTQRAYPYSCSMLSGSLDDPSTRVPDTLRNKQIKQVWAAILACLIEAWRIERICLLVWLFKELYLVYLQVFGVV